MKSCTLVVMRAGAVRLQQCAGERLQRWKRGGFLIPVCRLCSRGFPGLSFHPPSLCPSLPHFSAVFFRGLPLLFLHHAAPSPPPTPLPPITLSAWNRATPPLLHLQKIVLQEVLKEAKSCCSNCIENERGALRGAGDIMHSFPKLRMLPQFMIAVCFNRLLKC